MQLIAQTAGATTLDPAQWGYRVGAIKDELQAYTASGNVRVREDGWIVLEARREQTVCEDGVVRDYSSARIHSRGLWTIKPGYRMEVEAVLPSTPGCFPAIWLTGASMYTVGWPAAGEIDIVEVAGGWNPKRLLPNAHSVSKADGTRYEMGWTAKTWKDLAEPVGARKHRFGVHFDGNGIRWYLDGAVWRTLTRATFEAAGGTWPFGAPMELTMNLAVGSAGGDPALGSWPAQMLIGPVRIYAPGEPVPAYVPS